MNTKEKRHWSTTTLLRSIDLSEYPIRHSIGDTRPQETASDRLLIIIPENKKEIQLNDLLVLIPGMCYRREGSINNPTNESTNPLDVDSVIRSVGQMC